MDYDLRSLPRHILWEMQEITQANLFGNVNDDEADFWHDKHRAINLELQRRRDYEQDPDFSRALHGTGWSAPLAPDTDQLARDVQARVPKVDTSHRTFGRTLDRKTASGRAELQRLRHPSLKKPQVGQLE